MTGRWRVRPVDRPAGSQVPAKLTDEGSLVRRPAAAPSLPLDRSAVLNDTPVACQTREPTDPQGDRCPHIPAASAATYPLRCFAPQWARFDNRHSTSAPTPTLTASAAAAQGLFRAPARAFLLSPTAPFLPTAEEMGERTPAETAFLHFLSAQHLFAAARAFPHVTGVFLIVVVPPTVPAQLSAAAACYYGKNYSFCRVAG